MSLISDCLLETHWAHNPHAEAYKYVCAVNGLDRKFPCKTRDEWEFVIWAELRLQRCALDHVCGEACYGLGFSVMLYQLYLGTTCLPRHRRDFCALTLLRRGEQLNRDWFRKARKEWAVDATTVLWLDTRPAYQTLLEVYLRVPGHAKGQSVTWFLLSEERDLQEQVDAIAMVLHENYFTS
jgi:hypothetical protein